MAVITSQRGFTLTGVAQSDNFNLPDRGHIVRIRMAGSAGSQGPIWGVIFVRINEIDQGMESGVIRGNSISALGDFLEKELNLPLDPKGGNTVRYTVVNNTGSNVDLSLAWIVET